MLVRTTIQIILPLACVWVEMQERIILRNGVALTPALFADAKHLGIVHPERVRLLAAEKIPPLPLHPWLRRIGERFGLIPRYTAGMSFRYGILIRSDWWGYRKLIVHELTHTAQYERLGGFRPFLEEYLLECVSPGYPFGLLEREAARMADEICR